MGVFANCVWLPLMLMAIIVGMAIAQSNDTANSNDDNISSSTMPSTSSAPDLVVSGDLNKAARVEQMSSDMVNDQNMVNNQNMVNDQPAADTDADTMTTPKSTDGQYDVIDVMANTGMGKAKSGQTTRIYTTGEVNDDFWLKHLGDDFKHAIHLQVGGTNEDYNRIINQTSSGGVHEEVHHEYLPGAERPEDANHHHQQQQQVVRSDGYGQPNMDSHVGLDSEAMALKDNYFRQQEQQGYAQHNTRYNTHNTYNTHNNNRHSHTHTHTYPTHVHTQQHSRGGRKLRKRYKNRTGSGPSMSIINSSEDTLHAAQSQASSTSAAAASSISSSSRRDDIDNPLPFKSPFNDYGSRPTRDLTYLLYKRGL